MTRAAQVAKLRAAEDRADIHEVLFRALFALPASLQLEVAAATIARVLPIFEAHARRLAWSLEDLVRSGGSTVVREEKRDLHELADAEFDRAVSAFYDAVDYHNHDDVLASQCCHAIIAAIDARAAAAWARDEAGAPLDTSEFESLRESVVAAAVERREWAWLADELERRGVSGFAPADAVACEAVLARWAENEYLWLSSADGGAHHD